MITAGAKGGTVDGGAGDDSIIGGDGNDVFIYSDGDDTISNYTQSKDKIKFGAVINHVEFDGDDVLFVTDAGTLTVQNSVSTKIKTVDVEGHSSNLTYDAPLPRGASYNGSHNTVRFEASFGGAFNANLYSSKIKTLNATKTVNPIALTGNENKNVLKAGSGGSTLDGGAGNDKLYGGAGQDVFVYSYIYKYVEGQDEIVIADGEIDSVNVKGSSVTLYFDEGSLTISKAKGKTLTITDAFGDRAEYVFKRSTDEFASGLLEVAADGGSELSRLVGDNALGTIDLGGAANGGAELSRLVGDNTYAGGMVDLGGNGLFEVASDGGSELDQIIGDKTYAVGMLDLDIGGDVWTDAFKSATEKITASKKVGRG